MAQELERSNVLDEVTALLAEEPGGAGRLRGAALLVLDAEGRPLAGSPHAVSALGGWESITTAAGPRLGALAAGAASRSGLRLERLRLGPSRLAPPRTCACRLVRLASGEDVLAVVLPGEGAAHEPRPESPSPPAPEAPRDDAPGSAPFQAATPDDGEVLADQAGPQAAPEAETGRTASPALREHGPARFLWKTNAEGRFVSISSSLADLVGAGQADLVGRSWGEIAGRLVHDPDGAVAAALSRGETFSGRRVLWRTGEGLGLPVDLAGSPVGPASARDRAGSRAYRGFGLCRTGEIGPWPAPAGEPESPPPGIAPPPEPDASPSRPGPAESFDGWCGLFTALEGWTMALLGAPRPARPGEEAGLAEPAAEAGDPGQPPEARPEPAPEPPPEPPAEARPAPHLSNSERNAFREIARALGARFEGDEAPAPLPAPASPEAGLPGPGEPPPEAGPPAEIRLLERLPIGVLVHRGDEPLHANRALLDLVGYESLADLAAAGGVGALFPGRTELDAEAPATPTLRTARRESVGVDVRITSVEWDGAPAGLMLVRRAPEAEIAQRLQALELDLRAREARILELSAILDTAADGIILLDEAGRILSLNRPAEALFGYDQREVVGEPFVVLLAPESRRTALDYLDGLRANGVASVLNDGRNVVGRVAQGGSIPLVLALGQVSEGPDRRFCAVLRDVTVARTMEAELRTAKQAAEAATSQRAAFLGRISHEVRTPLNAIIGFSEVMLEEHTARQGAAIPERHVEYLRDIRESGRQVVRVVDDLLDLARVEAGQMEMAFTGLSLTEAVLEAIGPLQAQAAARRVVIRTGLAPRLPPVVADARSLRQIVENVVSNAIRFTDPGGQVIVSTALTEGGEVVFRTRDTGIGMSRDEIEAALEPFRPGIAAKRGGAGLGLPLTKALVEANRGALHIASTKGEGTLVEVVFPPSRVLAD